MLTDSAKFSCHLVERWHTQWVTKTCITGKYYKCLNMCLTRAFAPVLSVLVPPILITGPFFSARKFLALLSNPCFTFCVVGYFAASLMFSSFSVVTSHVSILVISRNYLLYTRCWPVPQWFALHHRFVCAFCCVCTSVLLLAIPRSFHNTAPAFFRWTIMWFNFNPHF